MLININDYARFNVTQAKNDSQHAPNKTETNTSNNVQNDSIKLTKVATKLQALEQQISDSPDIDRSHVERIKNEINNNQFKFDGKHVAERIIGLESSLNGIRN